MKRNARLAITNVILLGLMATAVGVPGISSAGTIHHRKNHRHRQSRDAEAAPPAVGQAGAGPAASPDSVGSLFGGLGRAYDDSPFGYNGPLGFGSRAKAQIGSALVGGGAAGDAYTDYIQHYYFYKYDYCPLGSKYVWYLRRCFSPFDLFR